MSAIKKSIQILSVQSHIKLIYRLTSRNNTTTAAGSSEAKIIIPKRIPRGPTDILYALSATVGKDPTAAHYKYHDDPYLIPMSNIGKRTFAMAQEAGRKAAKWIKQEHKDLFQHQNAQPPIEAYIPTMVYTETSEVDLESLKKIIGNGEVTDAILVYKLLTQKGVDIPTDIKIDLLELICFYNHENTLSEDLIEEKWFSQSSMGKERQRKTWKDGDLAEQIFAELEPSTRTYCAIIRGMCKFYQCERAWALFQEALDKNFAIDVYTYNSIIQISNFLKESNELRWELVKKTLETMAEKNVQPNLGTLNSSLHLISTIGNNRQARTFALQSLAEFKALGIQPSLATWYYVLAIFCRERGPVSHVLVDILNQVEGKEFQIQDPKDIFFFVTAMDVCRNHLVDKDLAHRVNNCLHFANNYDLIGDSYKESIYYRHLFGLLCSTEPIETFMETYNHYVPNIYTPEPGIMAEILKNIDINGAIELLPQLFSDMVIFDHTNRDSLLQQILKIMVDNKPNVDLPIHEGLNNKFCNMSWQIWDKIENQQIGRTNQLVWTGQMLGDVLSLCCRDDDYAKALQVFTKLDKEEQAYSGTPVPGSIKEFITLCVTNKEPSKAISALQYALDNFFPDTDLLAKSITDNMTLDEPHLSKISSLVGQGGNKNNKFAKNKENTTI